MNNPFTLLDLPCHGFAMSACQSAGNRWKRAATCQWNSIRDGTANNKCNTTRREGCLLLPAYWCRAHTRISMQRPTCSCIGFLQFSLVMVETAGNLASTGVKGTSDFTEHSPQSQNAHSIKQQMLSAAEFTGNECVLDRRQYVRAYWRDQGRKWVKKDQKPIEMSY